MKFKWVHVKTKNRLSIDELEIPCGNIICGLQMRQSRPHSVELTLSELQYLLKTPEYAAVICGALNFKKES